MSNTFKIIAATVFCLFSLNTQKVNAQAPLIKDLRGIIALADENFVSLRGEKLEPADGLDYYAPSKEHVGAKGLITVNKDGESIYYILYTYSSEAYMLKLQMMVMQTYIQEINDMAKSGNYTMSESQVSGKNLTKIFDLKGNSVAVFYSDKDGFGWMIYGHKK